MNKKSVFVFATLFCAVSYVSAQTVIQIPDSQNLSTSNNVTVADGSVISTNGSLIVFEGELIYTETVTAEADNDGRLLAATQLTVQMDLFESLPDTSLLSTAQAGVIGLLNESSLTEGTLYALTVNSSSELEWVQLLDASNQPIPVVEDTSYNITVILRYPSGTYMDHTYNVTIVPSDSSSSIIYSQSVDSASKVAGSFSSVTLAGKGSVAALTTETGDMAPLSSQIDFAVYYNRGEFIVDIYTANENGSGEIDVYALIDNDWVWIGSVTASGTGDNHYQLTVSGLEVGESYRFKVIDEEENEHISANEIEVKSIVMQAVQFDLETIIIQLNSEPGAWYQVLTAADVNTPLENWSVEPVQVNVDGEWSDFMSEFQGLRDVNQTQIRVPKNKNKAFFKVILDRDR